MLTLDLPGVNASIGFDNNLYTNFSDNLNNLYIDEEKNISINATDKISSIVSIKYYVSSTILTKEDLDNLDFQDADQEFLKHQIHAELLVHKHLVW